MIIVCLRESNVFIPVIVEIMRSEGSVISMYQFVFRLRQLDKFVPLVAD